MRAVVPHSRPWLTDAEVSALQQVCLEGQIAAGERSRRFAEMAARLVNREVGVPATTGTHALIMALRLLRLPVGAEVIVPTYVCESVAHAVRAVQAAPVFCDVDAHGLMTASTVAAAATPRTAAVICVHLFGQMADTLGIRALGWPVIDDCCQAAGIPLPRGTPAVLSFHATKCLTTGEGGLLAFDQDERLAGAPFVGDVVYRFSDLQAALGLVQVHRYPEMLERRARTHAQYDLLLKELGLAVPTRPTDGMPPHFRYTLPFAPGFLRAVDQFARHGVTVRRGVDVLLHRQAGLPDERFPGAVLRFEHTVSIPAHASLSDVEVAHVRSAMAAVLTA